MAKYACRIVMISNDVERQYVILYKYTLRPLCGYHFSIRRRRRIPKTNSKDEFPEDELRPEDGLRPEDDFPPKTNCEDEGTARRTGKKS